jgi:fumarate hydratase subunit alpha
MRTITTAAIKKALEKNIAKANFVLRGDLLRYFARAAQREKGLARFALQALTANAAIARNNAIPLCQDTGLPLVFVEIGQSVRLSGKPLEQVLQEVVRDAYKKHKFRRSVVRDPLFRKSPPMYGPAVIYYTLTRGKNIKITFMPKGFGSENITRLKMFLPQEGVGAIKKFVVDTVREVGPNACPPYIIGIGVGGDSIKALMLAKEALCIPLAKGNPDKEIARVEKELCAEINRLKIGPCGFAGAHTCLAVKIRTYPTHIAGLPVGLQISCHSLRNISCVL